VSDEKREQGGGGGWVPSPEQPVPPTTEFQAVDPDAVQPIDGATEPDETPAPSEAAAPPSPTSSPAASSITSSMRFQRARKTSSRSPSVLLK
jgi:hypothetical protein